MHNLLSRITGMLSLKDLAPLVGTLRKDGFVRISKDYAELTPRVEVFLKKYKTIKCFTTGFRL